MDKRKMMSALKSLDEKMPTRARLLLGGGGAMVLAYNFGMATNDLDALFYKSPITEADLQKEIEQVSNELDLPKDWLNPHFQTFLFTLPKNYGDRLQQVYVGKKLVVEALGAEDLLILKCFAGREKDIPHARYLVRRIGDKEWIRDHIIQLKAQKIPGATKALDFLDELLDESEEQ